MAIQTNFPAIKPTLLLDFANTKQLDPRVTFTRASTGTFYGTQTAKAEENLLLQSQAFISGEWIKTNTSVTSNTSTAPDGTTTATTLTAAAGLSAKILSQGATPIASSAYTMSFFVKAGTHNFVQLMNAADAQAFANFDVSTGTVGTTGTKTTASAVSIGSGWYRCVVTFNATATLTAAFRLYMVASNTAAWDSTLNATGTETLLLWGAQLEQRSAVTAYTVTTTQPITNYIPVLQTAASGVARFEHNPITFESLGLEIEEQRTNLVLRSEEFDNAVWVKNACTVSANTLTAPDGAITADKLVEDTSTGLHFLHYLATFAASTSYTVSVYAKAGERTRFQIGGSGSAWASFSTAVFDLSAGTVVTNTGAFTSASITPVGNGWYRCTATGLSNASPVNQQVAQFFLVQSGTTTSYTGNGFNGLFLWGAQLEAGAFPTSYIQTVASQVTRAADAASMTGTNFSSWYNQAQGTLYAEAGKPLSNYTSTRIIAEIGDGTIANRMNLNAQSTTTNALFAVTTNSTSVATPTIAGVFANGYGEVAGGYIVDNVQLAGNGTLATADTSCQIPVVNRMTIGDINVGGLIWNGTIAKIAYYPLRVTNANLQALTS
jgi:hypothetical protein